MKLFKKFNWTFNKVIVKKCMETNEVGFITINGIGTTPKKAIENSEIVISDNPDIFRIGKEILVDYSFMHNGKILDNGMIDISGNINKI